MTSLDLLVAPIFIVLVVGGAYILRPFVSTRVQSPYFFPALVVKLICALGLGILYQFYYTGGDTYTYFTHGASHIFQAFQDSPLSGLRLIFLENDYQGGVYKYAREIWVYRDSSSFLVVRVAGLFSLFALGTYSGTAILFALFSFSGMWAMFVAFANRYPSQTKLLAVAVLFIPSVSFWGSGILKDSLTMGALGWATWGVLNLFFSKRNRLISFAIIVVSLLLIYLIKKYIVLCFLPAVFLMLFLRYLKSINRTVLRILVAPVMLITLISLGYLMLNEVSKEDPRYALDKLGQTAMTTALDIGYWTGKDAGSKYSLGTPDASLLSMLLKSPLAINVTLFRPYLWEVRNPLMLFSAVESLVILVLTVSLLLASRWNNLKVLFLKPDLVFCLFFALVFSFAVGISTYNFGTLSRYKIPALPYYVVVLVLMRGLSKQHSRSKQHVRIEENPYIAHQEL